MISALQWIVIFVLTSMAVGWLERSRNRTTATRTPDSLYHPPSTLILGLVTGEFFAGIAVVSYLYSGTLRVSLGFLIFALVGGLFIVEYIRVQHELGPGGMRYRKVFGNGGNFLWQDVVSVKYSRSAKWFRIVTASGEVIKVSAMLAGLPQFARAVLAGVDPDKFDDTTRVVLEQTATGFPPPLM